MSSGHQIDTTYACFGYLTPRKDKIEKSIFVEIFNPKNEKWHFLAEKLQSSKKPPFFYL